METAADLKADILVALAHPNRIKILEHLQKDVRCNCQLAPMLGLEQSNLSRHLKILVQAGILISWKEGLRVNFKIADGRVLKIIDLALLVAKQTIESKEKMLKKT